MDWTDIMRFALHATVAHRLRSLLTMLGIMVGIAAVVLLTAIGEGIRLFALGEFTQFGTNIVAAVPGKSSTFGNPAASISTVRPLTLDDARALRRIPAIEAVLPLLQGNASVEYGEFERRTMVFGASADLPEVWKMGVRQGRFLPEESLGNARNFAVLGATMHRELFGSRNPLGARIRVGSERFRVIGVMESKGNMLGFDLDDTLFIPVARAQEIFDFEGVMEIDVTYKPEAGSEAVAAAMKRLLIARHGSEDFTLITQDNMLEVLDSVLSVLTLGVAAMGAISLLVGAVGILTIMTISVTERTAEIGLLRAIGAYRGTILSVFLTEAVVIAAIGGLAGIGAALALVGVLQLALPDLPVVPSWPFIGLAFLVALAIGLAAGIVPALRASGMHPLEALRAE